MGNRSFLQNFSVRYFPALVSGVMATLSFPDAGIRVLAWTALVPLMVSLSRGSARQRFLAGLAAGTVHYMTLIYWLVGTLEIYGGLPRVLAWSCLVLLSIYLALYWGVFCLVMKTIPVRPVCLPLAGAALWVGLEYIRTWLFTGFPWGLFGYSQYGSLKMIQIADITGVYGVSFLIVMINLFLTEGVARLRDRQGPVPVKETVLSGFLSAVMLAGVFGYGHFRMQTVHGLAEKSPQAVIGVVQGNIRQDLKWDRTFRQETIDRYLELSSQLLSSSPALMVWPETAMPFYYNYDNEPSNRLDRGIRGMKTHFLVGSPAVTVENDRVKIYNRAFMLDRFGVIQGTYDKIHLVPFGEYVPLEEYLTFLGKITEQAGNFSSGQKLYRPLPFKPYTTGVLICFEVLFPGIAAKFTRNGAHLLTTMTNDAWFGLSSATMQHFSICVFRAVENRRCVARSANTGISGFIGPDGKICETTGLFTAAAIARSLPMMTVKTIYTRSGDLFAIGCLLAIGLMFVIKGRLKTAGEKQS